jgi:OmpA-OmpF porin, OOP family
MKENTLKTLRLLFVLMLLLLTSCAMNPVPVSEQVVDTDGDGVIDALDRCPDTEAGIKIDVNGCPHDEDLDGVFDFRDQCRATPRGIPVDLRGCPRDDDGDGVENGQDQCPQTASATQVDARGCPEPVAPLLPETLELNFTFRTASADLDAVYAPAFAEGAAFIKAHQACRILIEGHTDSVGSQAYNQQLSLRRAAATEAKINALLVDTPPELEVVGYGEEQPIADNLTQEGRQRNRRALLSITCRPVGGE